uniref:ORF1 n=1 Tax=Okra leaf curl betasatellite TaxID=756759 RepID=B8XX94_9VIRU|nr:ORF1 [Okra leaf curl betasatellite]
MSFWLKSVLKSYLNGRLNFIRIPFRYLYIRSVIYPIPLFVPDISVSIGYIGTHLSCLLPNYPQKAE